MIEARVSTDHARLIAALHEQQLERLKRATVFLWSKVQEVLNTPNTGVRVRRRRGKGSYTKYPGPSRPGEPPRKRTGWLQRNVSYEVDREELTARLGMTSAAPYGLFLDVGTRGMEARPFLVSTAKECLPRMRRIMAGE